MFPSHAGDFWRATDWRNWRKRVYRPVAEAVGIDGARPYDLRHAFASLLIHEGRLSVVEIAAAARAQPDGLPRTRTRTSSPSSAEPSRSSAEEQIRLARKQQALAAGNGVQLSFGGFE